MVQVDTERCDGCGECVEACVVEAMHLEQGKAVVGPECIECLACLDVCPNGAISEARAPARPSPARPAPVPPAVGPVEPLSAPAGLKGVFAQGLALFGAGRGRRGNGGGGGGQRRGGGGGRGRRRRCDE